MRWWTPPDHFPGPWIGLLLCAPLFLLPNYGYYHDGVMNASYVLFGDWLQRLHPHHPGYNVTIWSLWYTLGSIGLTLHPLTIMAGLGRIAALVVLWQTWHIGRHLGLPGSWATLGQLLLGTSFGLWAYATNASVYVPALACVLALLLIAKRWLDRPPTVRELWQASAWLVLATLWHQLAILAALPTAIWTITQLRAREEPAWPSMRIAVGGTAAALVVAYTVAFLVAFEGGSGATASDVWRWLFRYGRGSHYWSWGETRPATVADATTWQQTIDAHGRLALASNLGERFDPIAGQGFAASVQESLPAARMQRLWNVMLPILIVLLLAGSARVVVRDPGRRPLVLLCAGWIATFAGFSALFEPQLAHYRLYYWPLLLLLVTGLGASCSSRLGQFLSASVAGVWMLFALTVNAAYGYLPRSRMDCNPALMTVAVLTELTDGTLAMSGYGESFEEFHLARLLLPERPIYKLQWFSEEEYAVSNFGFVPLPDRLRDHSADFARLPAPLYVSLGRPMTDRRVPTMERPIWRLSELQSGRGEPQEVWLDFRALALQEERLVGEYEVWIVIDPLQLPAH